MYLDSFLFNRDLLTQRDSHECNSGQLWYVCVANNFQGCCSVDACQVDECPDDSTAAVDDATTTTTRTSSSTKTTTTTDSAAQTSSQNTPSSSTSISNSPSATISSQTISSSPSISQAATGSQSSRPPADLASTTSPAASSVSKSPNNVPIIVGSAAGGVALILLAILGFFCFRRRQKKKQNRQLIQPPSPAFTFFNPAGKATPSSLDSRRRSVLEDVFAPFGGRYHTGTTNPSTPIPTITTTHASPQLQDQIQRTMSPDSGPLHDTDPEKSGLTAPPESSHPAFHPLPGIASTRPAYLPNEGFTISELDGKPIDAMPAAVHQYQRVSELDSDDGRPSPMSTPGQSYGQGQGRESWRSPSPGASIPAWKKSIQEHRRWERAQNGGESASSSDGPRGYGNGETMPMLPASSSQTQRYPSQNQKRQQHPAPQFQYPNPHQYQRSGSRNGKGKGSTDSLARDASTHSVPVGLGLGSSSASHSRSHSAAPAGPEGNPTYNAYDSSYSKPTPHHYQNQQQQQPPYPDYPEVVHNQNNSNQYSGESSQYEQYMQRGDPHVPRESVSSMGTSTAYGRTPDLFGEGMERR